MLYCSNPYLSCNGKLCAINSIGQFETFWPWHDAPLWGYPESVYSEYRKADGSWKALPVGFKPLRNIAPPDRKLAQDVEAYVDAAPEHFIDFDTGKPYTAVLNSAMGQYWADLFWATDSLPDELIWNVTEYIRKNCAGEVPRDQMNQQVPWARICIKPKPEIEPAIDKITDVSMAIAPKEPPKPKEPTKPPTPEKKIAWPIIGLLALPVIGYIGYKIWTKSK